jgi:cysteine-rich repeat protein
MRKRATTAFAVAFTVFAGSVLADHHLVKVVEVFPGTEAQPNAQYVVIQAYSSGQQLMGGHGFVFTDANGTVIGSFTFPADLSPTAPSQTKFLAATAEAAALFGVTADLTIQPVMPRGGGRVCFDTDTTGTARDCVAWGGYTGPAVIAGPGGANIGPGTPFAQALGLRRGEAMKRRLDICMGATTLESCDDTQVSSADFVSGPPAPQNFAGAVGTIPPSTCGNGVLQSLEGCDDGNLANGDGCSSACLLEAGNADSPVSLQVDPSATATSNGNGVLEPGETSVVVIPGWRNDALVARGVDGAVMSFTGAAGGTYLPLDRDTTYGTLGAGASGVCGGVPLCYAVRVNVTARPSVRWSATLTEATNSGTTKAWDFPIGNSFVDVAVAANPYYKFIETLLHNGVTTGCGGNLYCPTNAVTREQMSVFLLVSKEGEGYNPPACTAPTFNDVPCASPFSKWIEELADRGVTSGCGNGNYCPTSPVTRDQMAVFLLVTEEGSGYSPPACVTPMFSDVPCANGFAKWINELVSRGVTAGCGGGNYCPSQAVTREQMAVFLTVTFGLKLYGP